MFTRKFNVINRSYDILLCFSRESLIYLITRNQRHITSRIAHVNQKALKKWLPGFTKKCMEANAKYRIVVI